MRQGKVKWYNGKKCFGFITPDSANEAGNTDDVFVHSSSLKAADIRFLNENDIVRFEEEIRNDGKLSVTTLELVKRDEESAKKFQERRSQHGDRDGGYRGNRDDRGDRRSGFAFWKK